MLKSSETYTVGFDLSEEAEDVAVLTVTHHTNHGHWEHIKTVTGEAAKSLYEKLTNTSLEGENVNANQKHIC